MSLRTGSRRFLSTLTAVGMVAALGSAFGAVGVTPVQAATACSGSTFTTDCDYTVPTGVHSLSVTVTGAAGGLWHNPLVGSPVGGNGAIVTASVSVTPGAVIHVLVGGQGGEGGLSTTGGAGGHNGGGSGGNNASGNGTGGGGGGGYSALLSGTTPLVLAGGGGGAAHGDTNDGGEHSYGGNAGLTNGGAANGGCCARDDSSAAPGTGASPSAVGIGGISAFGGDGAAVSGADGTSMASGGAGSGGAGGASDTADGGLESDGGGGGGGGYNGGGGGGGNATGGTGGSGGGGSSYIDPAFGTGTFATASAPAAGSVTITPGPVTPPQVPLKNCVTPPSKHGIPLLGVKQLMKAHCYTNAGQRVKVRVMGKLLHRGDARTFRLIRKSDGQTLIKTYGNPVGLTITWSAPASGNYEAYSLVKSYRT